MLRLRGTTVDMQSGFNQSLQPSMSRLAALKHTRGMPTSVVSLSPEESSFTTTSPAPSEVPVPSANRWVQLGPTAVPRGQSASDVRLLVTGRVTAIVIHPVNPDIIYVGTAQGGIWKTIDGGRNWNPISDHEKSLAIGALVIDPKNHDILYAGTGEGNLFYEALSLQQSYYGCGILKTTNAGGEWKLYGGQDDDGVGGGRNGPFVGARFFRLAINPLNPNIIFAATSLGLYKSINGGEAWRRMEPGSGIPAENSATDIVFNPINPDIAYAAIWGVGLYKTGNANDEEPLWTSLLPPTNGIPITDLSRIALGISPTSPDTIFALMANESEEVIDKFYWSKDGGSSWSQISLPGFTYDKFYPDSIGPQGTYNINVAVDPTTPDRVYLSAVSLWQAIRNVSTNSWAITEIGTNIHSDNHALAFHPTNHLGLYAGNDGGIYKSNDAGQTWNDVINEGLCITQFGFMDQHPTSDALILAGTQDNGTLQFRNSSAFYHSADGDGGFVAIDQNQPNIMLHEYYKPSPERSEQAGRAGIKNVDHGGSWLDVGRGLSGSSLFYPPFTLDQSNSQNIAFGTDRIFLDSKQGLNRWKSSTILLPGLNSQSNDYRGPEVVSSISYVNSNPGLLYAGTNYGKVFRITKRGNKWLAQPIHSDPLPSLFIWDISPHPGNATTIIVVMAGVGSLENPLSHVWRGEFSENEGDIARWVDISGSENGKKLPDTPVNCLVVEPESPNIMYIGTDIGVFRTLDGGNTWTNFSQGLPNCAIFDMRLHTATRLLRAATHGRGIWELNLDAQTIPEVDLFVRNNIMDTGRSLNKDNDLITAAFENPFPFPAGKDKFNVKLGESLSWSMCADIKVDPPLYQFTNPEQVDYVKFETELLHSDPQRGRINHVYAQIHNRGIKPAGMPPANDKVSVKIMYANVLDGYPDLPQDFWEKFSDDSFDKSNWKPIGETKFLPSPPKTLTNTEPTILSWDWNPSSDVLEDTALMIVIDSPEDPIPQENKNILNVEEVVRKEKRIGLKRMRVVDV